MFISEHNNNALLLIIIQDIEYCGISTDENPSLRIESFAIINLRGVSQSYTLIDNMQGIYKSRLKKADPIELNDLALLTYHKHYFFCGQLNHFVLN